MTPRATYRIQFGPSFGFGEAAGLAPYLSALGVSHVYLAPVFAARPGSSHGYDVTDPAAINPELGGDAGFRAMARTFREAGLGLLLDIVPNHMGIGGETNPAWLDVLEWGRQSRFAGWFDIDWAAPGLDGRLLLPVLGEAYGLALEGGALELRRDAGGFAVWAHRSHRLPVSPRSYASILRAGGAAYLAEAAEALDGASAYDPRWAALKARIATAPEAGAAAAAFRGNPASLDRLIEAQAWRPAKFTLDRDELNYRRFFAISDLAAVRVEDPDVFAATQALPLALVEEGIADGLRVDHVDGLRDPKAYLHALREGRRPFWLLVEKILAPDETLPSDWGIDGTTGYEAANLLVGLLTDREGAAAIERDWRCFTAATASPEEAVLAAKREVLERMLASELEALAARLRRLGAGSLRFRDVGSGAVRVALVETIAALGVYRTYADAEGIGEADRARLAAAVAAGRAAAAWLEPDAFELVAAVLGLDATAWPEDGDDAGEALREAAFRAQQLTGPAMAKGLEDTALYRHVPLLALNEVGSHPGHIASLAEFHAKNASRGPRAMVTTSTHDTKRGEDARARIAVLSRCAADWGERVRAWHDLLDDPAQPLTRNEAWLFFQLLLGAWPAEWREAPDATALAAFAQRVRAAMLKSVREAGVTTRWIYGDAAHEAVVEAYVNRALAANGAFLASFREFEAGIATAGAWNGLIQAALKLTIPGVPDTYRGAEVWEQSLVDPDNRRPFDFASAADLLAALPEGAAAFADPTKPAAKLALTARLLAARRANPELFAAGSYAAIDAGPQVCAFVREHPGAAIVTVARLDHRAAKLPEGLGARWTDVLTGGSVTTLPIAVFLRHG